jgi:hypothetical protein
MNYILKDGKDPLKSPSSIHTFVLTEGRNLNKKVEKGNCISILAKGVLDNFELDQLSNSCSLALFLRLTNQEIKYLAAIKMAKIMPKTISIMPPLNSLPF